MTIRWPSDMLNRFIAPDIDKFDRADIPDLRNRHPESSHWLGNHFLNNVLRGSFGAGAPRQFAANLIFRADTAFQRYHQARDATNEFVAASSAGSPAARKYFESIAHWESCLLNVQIFVDLFGRLEGKKVYEPGDGSNEERACLLANRVKHWGEDIVAKDGIPDNYTIPIWLTNDGIRSQKHSLDYEELSSVLDDMSTLANQIQDPAGYGQSTPPTS